MSFEPLLPAPAELAFATDLYQLTMMAAYRSRDLGDEATSTFELFVRRLPKGRGFLVAAGLEQAMSYLSELRFTDAQVDWLQKQDVFRHVDSGFFDYLRAFEFRGSVDAVPEGTVVFPNEPLLRVRAPLAQAQLVETYLLATINAQTLIASKAARVRLAAGERTVIDFGARRAHGFGAALLASRACWIAGLDGTSNVLAGQRLGLPVLGTAAHAFIMSYEDERDAFDAYHAHYPEHCVLLIDTYDTLEGCRRAAAIGPSLSGVRLDSGDLGELAKKCRKLLDERGLYDTRIVASGDLNELKIAKLIADGAPIDSFGVGTELVTSRDQPALGGVYKLVERTEGERRIPVIKLSKDKITWPSTKQVHRVLDADGALVKDVIELSDAPAPEPPSGGRVVPLLREVMKDGQPTITADDLSLADARERCRMQIDALPPELKELEDYAEPPTEIGPALRALADELRDRKKD